MPHKNHENCGECAGNREYIRQAEERIRRTGLTPVQLSYARRLARRDYEVRQMLAAYEAGTLDLEGFSLLLEEVALSQEEKAQ